MTRRLLALFVAVGAIAAAPAGAQTVVSFGFGGPTGATIISATDIPVSTTGELVVSFHGDAATGCAASGLCGYSGTVLVRPGSGDLFVEKLRHGRTTSYDGFLGLGLGSAQALTAARVERDGSGSCADVSQLDLSPAMNIRAGVATLALLQPGGDVLATRCAGPVDADLAGTVPRVTTPLVSLLRGRMRFNLAGTQPFASHGFAGTVRSTIVLRLGRPQRQSSSSTFPPGIRTQKVRTVSERLQAGAAGGTLTALLAGTADATECGLLDSCGLAGTLTLAPSFDGLSGSLQAIGPAKRPYRDFLAALGRGPGNPRGIQVFGEIGWSQGGTVTEDITQAGTCTDSAVLGAGGIILAPRGSGLVASYRPVAAPRTRCPGPIVAPGQALATGTLARADLRRRTLTLNLSAAPAFQDDGYSATISGHFAFSFRRGPLTQQVTTQPTG